VATDYVVEKLVVAVEALAVSAAPIQQRVRNAWRDALVHLRPDDFEDPNSKSFWQSSSVPLAPPHLIPPPVTTPRPNTVTLTPQGACSIGDIDVTRTRRYGGPLV
jgi:hypothetical protein